MTDDHDTPGTRYIRQQIEKRRCITPRRKRANRLRRNVQRSADDLGGFAGAGQRAGPQPVEHHTESPQPARANAHLLGAFRCQHARRVAAVVRALFRNCVAEQVEFHCFTPLWWYN